MTYECLQEMKCLLALYVLQQSPEGRRGLFCPVSRGLGTNHSAANCRPTGGATSKSADLIEVPLRYFVKEVP